MEAGLFRHILVPLDGSQAAERVLEWLDPVCAPETVRHLVTVVPGAAGSEPSAADRLRMLEAGSYLSFLAAGRGEGVRCAVSRGEVVEEILRAAGAADADLIALSSHGESARTGMPCGSAAGSVILGATCPVLVIGAFAGDAGGPPSRPARILVALDGSPESEASLAPARSAARGWSAEVILLHVIEPLWAAGDSALAEMQAREVEATHRRLLDLVEELGRESIRAFALLSHGEPAREIVSQVVRRRAGLLCLSTAGRGAVGRLIFGSVAQKLIGALPVPAIIVRAARPAAARPPAH